VGETTKHAGGVRTELLWFLGEQGLRDYDALTASEAGVSRAFPNAGVYLLRHQDLYLHFNAGGIGVNGRGSHGHNDALSIEVSAGGTAFIVDPGSYVYTANLHERNLFRSTAWHSTVQVDGAEQNTIDERVPFVIGNEAQLKYLTGKRPMRTGFRPSRTVTEVVAPNHASPDQIRQTKRLVDSG
jgi:hypothetical protein